MIWKESVAGQPRVIIISHARYDSVEDGLLVSRVKNIEEEVPALVVTCFESRNVMLRHGIYHSVFKAPEVGNTKLHYIGNQDDSVIISDLARSLVPGVDQSRTRTPTGFMQRINSRLNRFPPAVIPHYAALLAREIGPLFPAYFNPVIDTLYIRVVGARRAYCGYRFVPGLWAPQKSHHASKIQSLAIELDYRIDPKNPRDRRIRTWTSTTLYQQCTGLKTLYLICLEDKEVIQLSFDDSNTLVENQWIYSLETGSKLFQKEMGENWTGVLWKVMFRKIGAINLWRSARSWKCASVKWEKEKRSVCKDNNEVPEEWFDVERVRGAKENGNRKGKTAKVVKGVKCAAMGEGWYVGQ